MDDLQSFTPLQFQPPGAQGWLGRALVVDPDVFSVSDVSALLERDMEGCVILARRLEGGRPRFASSVMLLDCERLPHWRCREQFDEMFEMKRDYARWIALETEPDGSVGELEPVWNDFDRLTPSTRMLHNTKRRTQPWKTGLPVDFTIRTGKGGSPLKRLSGALFRDRREVDQPQPDPAQERLFFALLREAVEAGRIDEAFVREEMERGHVRADALRLSEEAGPVDAVLPREPVPLT